MVKNQSPFPQPNNKSFLVFFYSFIYEYGYEYMDIFPDLQNLDSKFISISAMNKGSTF